MRILLVRLREIGDVVFTTPAIRGLRHQFPDAHITYVVEPLAAPVVVNNPLLDEVLVVQRGWGAAGLGADFALVRRLRARRYDIAIDFHGGPRSSVLTWLSGAPVRVGYEVVGRSWMYTNRVPRPRQLRPRHSVENQWDLLSALAIQPPEAATFPVEMASDPQAAATVADRLARAGIGAGDHLIVVHVSAGNPFRRWPIEHFVTLISAMASAQSCRRIIVMSGPSDRDAAGRVVSEAAARLPAAERHRVSSCGEFSLAELRALVDRAALFIGGDSGPLHIAATSTVPIVGLYGPTLPARSAPWRAPQWITESVEVDGLACRPCDQRTCAPGDFRCLTSLPPEQVIAAAEHALARAARAAGL